jgi:hypothetical protein
MPAFYRWRALDVAQAVDAPHMRCRDTCSFAAMMNDIRDIERTYVRDPKPKLDLYLIAA